MIQIDPPQSYMHDPVIRLRLFFLSLCLPAEFVHTSQMSASSQNWDVIRLVEKKGASAAKLPRV